MSNQRFTRRQAALAVAGFVAAPAVLRAQPVEYVDDPQAGGISRRVSSFRTFRRGDYFSSLTNGNILVDTDSRALHFWDETGAIYNVYPTSVPLTEELTRRGRTEVIQKRVGPDWRPTPNMLARNPELPEYVGPGPENPLGTHALYLTWTYYRIHGTNDTRKIGRMSSNGCIGLYNDHIEQLFALSKVGTQVLLI
ncbi:MAG: L,D-transpeptidase [Pseudomonadota bacterium]